MLCFVTLERIRAGAIVAILVVMAIFGGLGAAGWDAPAPPPVAYITCHGAHHIALQPAEGGTIIRCRRSAP